MQTGNSQFGLKYGIYIWYILKMKEVLNVGGWGGETFSAWGKDLARFFTKGGRCGDLKREVKNKETIPKL